MFVHLRCENNCYASHKCGCKIPYMLKGTLKLNSLWF